MRKYSKGCNLKGQFKSQTPGTKSQTKHNIKIPGFIYTITMKRILYFRTFGVVIYWVLNFGKFIRIENFMALSFIETHLCPVKVDQTPMWFQKSSNGTLEFKVPKESGLFARPDMYKLSETESQETIRPPYPICHSAFGGMMHTHR
jgi:hypothetical protein